MNNSEKLTRFDFIRLIMADVNFTCLALYTLWRSQKYQQSDKNFLQSLMNHYNKNQQLGRDPLSPAQLRAWRDLCSRKYSYLLTAMYNTPEKQIPQQNQQVQNQQTQDITEDISEIAGITSSGVPF